MLRLIALAVACCAALSGVAAAQTLDRIAATKTARIGFIADQAPFASVGSKGQPVGYAIDLCGRVVEQIGRNIDGVKPAYVETTLADAFAAVAADRIDLLCGAITVTLDRREAVDFSEPIFLTGMSALLRTDSPRDLRELFLGERTISPPRSPELRPFATSRIGVRTGTTTEAVLRRTVAEEGYGAAILDFATHAEGLAALESQEIDAYFGDRALLVGLLDKARYPSRLIVASRLVTRESYGIAMKRGDADLRLLTDRALSQFYATREFTELLVRYFGEQAPAIKAQILAQSTPE
jgi:polar amino acid transport system substrate-binding protein